jgi:general stress protein YciG
MADNEKKPRGFAAMDRQKQREIASKGGKAAHEKGTAHEFTRDEARVAGKKGGETVSASREHMATIGRKGGEAVSTNRQHMAEIGREGGHSSRGRRVKADRQPKEETVQDSQTGADSHLSG